MGIAVEFEADQLSRDTQDTLLASAAKGEGAAQLATGQKLDVLNAFPPTRRRRRVAAAARSISGRMIIGQPKSNASISEDRG
jgi:hypothetical protein